MVAEDLKVVGVGEEDEDGIRCRPMKGAKTKKKLWAVRQTHQINSFQINLLM